MTQQNATAAIRAALGGISTGDLTEASTQFLAALGYRSDRRLGGQTGSVGDFIDAFRADNAGTRSEQDFRNNAKEIRVLFQFTDTEIAAPAQRMLLDAEAFSAGNVRSFLFASVLLNGDTYPRGRYVSFTREINKRFNWVPAVVVFRTANDRVTLAFVNRRPSKTRADRQVLGSASLLREIDAANPHRAHLDILAELSLDARLRWMDDHGKPRNFDGLLEAWLDALDTEELNRRFYCDLFGWFERAVASAKFPTHEAALSAEEHVIRLITRLLFAWFIKEKGLIAEDLFIENKVRELLKDYDGASGDSYYRAVLQNLFFATLNTEIGQRRFSREKPDDHRNFSLYRYRDEIADPGLLLELFGKTPFINGGLFDCLDSFDSKGSGGVRVDCFTDNARHRAGYSIPNRLFFGAAAEPGLIELFNRYKFTVEENTPAEREVALDPELLGKVFENLLAAVNPETQKTARKETGSYYTPRAVVDYMVDEALVATLAQKASPEDHDTEDWQARLRCLLDYAFADAETLFTPGEREAIVRAIANLKALDPAVGSGAFPMGILHKLTLVLRRLDPSNELWENLQKKLAGHRASAAFDTADSEEREGELSEISRTFDKYRNSDFGRKLYLIQNSIYGVDIQPIATQIAKLRFFISLAIEQQPNDDPADNYGIKPLPNLESRFVVADTLRGLEKPSQMPLGQTGEVQQLEAKLAANRERHFHANTRAAKLTCRRQDAELRKQLATALQTVGFPAASAVQLAAWDPFDQNANASSWFNAEYMFGVTGGFDMVVGNPPYVESRNSLLSDEMKDVYISQLLSDWGEELPRGSDLLMYFLARAPKLLHSRGHGYLITQNAWLSTDYGKKFQDFSLGRFSIWRIVDTSAKFFSDSNGPQINAVIVVFGHQTHEYVAYEIVDDNMETTADKIFPARHSMKWGHLAAMPGFFTDMLTEMAERAGTTGNVSLGQGLNFPLKELNQAGSLNPVIVKDVNFVATSADGRIQSDRISAARRGKVPALIMPRGVGDRYYCTFNACKAFSYSGVECISRMRCGNPTYTIVFGLT